MNHRTLPLNTSAPARPKPVRSSLLRSSFARSTFAPASPVLAAILFTVAALFTLAAPGLHAQRGESANSLYKAGQSAEAREDYDTALDAYQKAYAKNPKDLSYRAALYRVRVSASSAHLTKGRKLLTAGDQQGALTEFLHAAEIDPANEAAQQEIARIRLKSGEAAPLA